MKHAVDEFLGEREERFVYVCTCGRRVASAQPLPEDGDTAEVEVAADGPGHCATCFPERTAARLDGVALHPDIGALEIGEDEQVLSEDHGEEEVLEEEHQGG